MALTMGPKFSGRMASRFAGFLIAVLAVAVATVRAQTGMQILATTLQLSVVNGFPLQNQSDLIQCTPGTYNYVVMASNGTALNVEFDCPTPVHLFDTATASWCPAEAVPTQSQACLVQNQYAYNESMLSQAGPALSAPPLSVPRTNASNPVGSFWGTVSSVAQTVGCSFANSATYGLTDAFGIGCSSNYVTLAQFANFAQDNADSWNAQYSWNAGVQAWENNATNEFGLLVNATQQIFGYEQANNWALSNLTLAVINQQTQINEIVSQTAAGLNAVQGELQQTNQNVQGLYGALSALATATATEFQNLTIQTFAALTGLTNQVNFLTNETTTNSINSNQNFLGVANNFIQIATAIQSIITQNQYLPLLRSKLTENQNYVNSLNTGGRNFQYMTEDPGQPGVANLLHVPSNLAKKTLEAIKLRYMFNTGFGGPNVLAIAANTQVELACSGKWLSLNQYPIQLWTQLIDTLGADNCTIDVIQQGPNFCDCYMRVTESTCIMPTVQSGGPTYGFPTPVALARWLAWDNPSFPNNATQPGAAFCASNPLAPSDMPGLPDGVIRNSTAFNYFQSVLCQRGINPAFPSYDAFSVFFSKRYRSDYTTLACTSNMLALMNPTGNAFNVVYSMMNFFLSAFTLSSAAVLSLSYQILGSLPLNGTYTDDKFLNVGAGPVQDCLSLYMTAYDVNHWVQIQRYTQGPVLKTVTVRVNGQPFSMNDDFTVTNDNAALLAELNGAYIAGIPGEQWVSSVYNIDYASSIPEPNPLANIGKPTYYCLPSEFQPVYPTTYNITLWRNQNFFEFNNIYGSTSWSVFRNALTCDSSSPPRCTCNGDHGTGTTGKICQLLQTCTATVLGDGVGFICPDDVMTGTITVPQGQAIFAVASACPIPSTDNALQNADYSKLYVALYNNLPTNNLVWIRSSGACGTTKSFTFQPLQTINYPVSYCPLEPGVPISLTFFNNAGGIFSQCNTTVNVTVIPTNPALSGVGATFETTEVQRAVTNNQALLNTQFVQYQSVQMVLALTTALAQIMKDNYLTFAPTGDPLGPFASVFSIINALGQNISDTLIASQNFSFSYTGDIADYSAVNAQLLNNTLTANAIAQNFTAALGATIQQEQVTLLNLIAINGQNQILLNQSAIALAALNEVTNQIIASKPGLSLDDALSSLIDGLVTIGGWPGDVLDKGLGAVETLGGDFADAAKGMFGGLGDMFGSIVMYIGLAAIVIIGVYLIYYCCVSKRKDDAEMQQLKARVAALEGRAGGTPVAVTAGGRWDAADDDSEPNCGRCCCRRDKSSVPPKRAKKSRATDSELGRYTKVATN
jgi:hypothetical protein